MDFRSGFPVLKIIRNFYVPTYATVRRIRSQTISNHGDIFSIPLSLRKTNIDLHVGITIAIFSGYVRKLTNLLITTY